MTEPQIRVLVMCEIHFYEASVSPSVFQVALRELGWKAAPAYEMASLESLKRLAKGLRSKLRTATI